MQLVQVISGGQTGVDQVGLEIARKYGYQTGGTAPKGYRTDAGPMPELLRDVYGLEESWSRDYGPRTVRNVVEADQTVWFGVTYSAGARLTLEICRSRGKPVLINPDAESLRRILSTSYPVRILNVAGNRLRTYPEAAAQARAVLEAVLAR